MELRERVMRWLAPDWVAHMINRRVEVEQQLWDAANGKRPPPTPDECRQWAIRLGTPVNFRMKP